MLASDTLAVDVAGAQALKARAAAGDKGALRAAAQQFESLMIGMMLKSMRETKFSDEDDPMTSGEGVKLYRDLLDQQWAERLAKGRGLGFADMIVKSMEKYGTTVPAETVAPPAGAGLPAIATVESRAAESLQLQRPYESGVPLAGASLLQQVGVPTDSQKPVLPAVNDRKRAFLETLRPHAEAAATATGVPADYILAHAALESGWGARAITGADGQASHNLFGIKAGSSWQGASVETLTTEFRQGLPLKVAQRFRAYADYGEAFSDYAGLLKSRYAAALESGDAGSFAAGLAAGGYASDPAYAGKLKSVIASVALAGA